MNTALASLPRATAERGVAHTQAMLLALGRHTLTSCLTTQARQHLDWSADYRAYSSGRLDANLLFGAVLEQAQASYGGSTRVWLALDDSTLRKSGRKVPLTAWRRDPLSPPFGVNFQWGHRVLQTSLLWPQPQGGARGLPVAFEVLLNRPRPKQQATLPPADLREALRQANVNEAAVRQLNRLAGKLARPAVAAVDGRFANKRFLRQLPKNVSAVARLRKDALLYRPPAETATTGRPRLYGAVVARPEALRLDESQPWQTLNAYAAGKNHCFKIKTMGPLRSKLTGAAPGRLMLIAPLAYRLRAGSKLLYRQPAYLWITDTEMSLQEALQGYLWRWEVEVNFRDEKTLLGVGQPQVWHPQSVQRLPAWQAAGYSAMLWSSLSLAPDSERAALPPPKWRRKIKPLRPSTQCLINRLRHDAWASAIRPESFRGFWTHPSAAQKPPKPHNSLAAALFLATG